MEQLIHLLKALTPIWFIIGACFLLAFGITYAIIPVIVRVARLKNLCASPNQRTSHSYDIPNLGGIALFIGFVISTIIFAGDFFTSDLVYIISGLVILFFIGMKDDILIIDPKKKLAAQIIVAFIVSIYANIKIVGIFEIFNNETINYLANIIMTVLMFVVIINGFNLIDGIDGLASGAGILSSLVFGLWFLDVHNIAYTVMSFSLAGSLLAFFIFNTFGKENKIFMGDAGSLILGLVISIMVVEFLNPDSVPRSDFFNHASPALAIGILILPLFDTIRIFTVRIMQGKSPFVADHQHIHHLLLEIGFSHLQSTVILLTVNVFFIIFCFYLQNIGSFLLILIVFALATTMSYFLFKIVQKHTKKVALEYDKIAMSGKAVKERLSKEEAVREPEKAVF